LKKRTKKLLFSLRSKSFLVLFFKKELLSCSLYALLRGLAERSIQRVQRRTKRAADTDRHAERIGIATGDLWVAR
jgi:hypothetical protein